MKKTLYVFIALFTLQIGFAQVSEEAKTYIKNAGIPEQLDATKTQILPAILEENRVAFNKDYDAATKNYISELETLVNDNFETADLKKYNESIIVNTAPEAMVPKDAVGFQQKANTLQQNLGLFLQGLMEKYADPAILQQMQQ